MRFEKRGSRTWGGRRWARELATVGLSALLFLSLGPWEGASAEEPKDFCVECHGKTSFLVTNKKLYSYFRDWRSSNHTRGGVTCVDCHGGDPESDDKEKAHRGDLSAAEASSAVNFRNIAKTCGRCHEHVYRGFRESAHFEHLVNNGQEDQAPSCVTCHGSMNVTVLNAYTVEEACRECHNQESRNHPESVEDAKALLRNFLSIRRYHHYIAARGDPAATKPFLKGIDARIHDLTETWHTFDLEAAREKSEAILEDLRARRDEVASAARERNTENRGQSTR